MAYMVYQQLTSAIQRAYRQHPDAERHLTSASDYRAWLASLDIDAKLKDPLVEQAAAIEAAFRSSVAPF